MAANILVVEDDENVRRVMHVHLERNGYQTAAAAEARQALEILRRQPQDLVISDVNLPGMSGLDLLKRIRAEHPNTTVVMITAFGTVETAVAAMKLGAFDYLTKPLHLFDLSRLVSHALERSPSNNPPATQGKDGFENILGGSKALLRVLSEAARVAKTDATVLIQGETGTGKGVLAKAIHLNSLRRDKPFVTINCGAIPRELLESELFGHLRGSFTGAMTHKRGKVELAEGGTLFLDEIGELPSDLQVRLLRLIQEREVDKVGAVHPIRVDVRIIAATHRDLQALVAAGTFREDLFYRVVVVPLEVPPLRKRPEDIPEFVRNFLDSLKIKHGKPGLTIPLTLMPYFTSYPWPGNIRELEHAIERIVVLTRGDQVQVEDLPEFLLAVPRRSPSSPLPLPPTPAEGIGLRSIEKEMIVQALEQSNWNQSRAARTLDISRKTLIYRIAKYGIERKGA